MSNIPGGLCFFISPIGEERSNERKRSDAILDTVLKPVMKKFKIKIERADDMDLPGNITDQIIVKIIKSDLVVADLSDANPNVYYELAARHMIEKPVIQFIEKGQLSKLPFDIRNINTLKYSWDKKKKELRDIPEFQKELEERISAIYDSLKEDNPDYKLPLTDTLYTYRNFLPIPKRSFRLIDMNKAHKYWGGFIGTLYAWNPSWQTELTMNVEGWMNVHKDRYLKNKDLKRTKYIIGRGEDKTDLRWQYFYLRGFKKFLHKIIEMFPEIKKGIEDKMLIYIVDELPSNLTFFVGQSRYQSSLNGLLFINDEPFILGGAPKQALVTKNEKIIHDMREQCDEIITTHCPTTLQEVLDMEL